jgi:hypothetical protein
MRFVTTIAFVRNAERRYRVGLLFKQRSPAAIESGQPLEDGVVVNYVLPARGRIELRPLASRADCFEIKD